MKHKFLIFFVFTFSIIRLSAHPHILVDLELKLMLDESGIYGLREKWNIQNQMGKQIVNQYDINGNGIFDPNETALLENEILPSLAANHFYTYFTLENGIYYPAKSELFSAQIERNKTVSFIVLLPFRIESRGEKRFPDLAVYDPTRYLSFSLLNIDDNPVPDLEFQVNIVRDGNVYSHGSKLGNAVMLIHLKRKEKITDQENQDSGLIRFSQNEISELEKRQNPFASGGIRIDELAGNPFMSPK